MLSLNPSEVIWTIINFFLLMFLLKHFLFTPIVRFMDDRDARIAAAKKAEADAQETVRACSEETAKNVDAVRAEAKRVIGEGKTADDQRHSDLIAKTKSANASNRKTMAADIAREKTELSEQLTKDKDALAGSLAEYLLGEDIGGNV